MDHQSSFEIKDSQKIGQKLLEESNNFDEVSCRNLFYLLLRMESDRQKHQVDLAARETRLGIKIEELK